jgi:diamine N-acetyltransferase
MITIAPLSPDNFEAVVALKVGDDQATFVASNVLSIAQSKTWDYLVPVAIENNGTPIGFALYGKDPKTQRVYIVRLMIDQAFQRSGHGAAALGLLFVKLRESYACTEIHVSVVPGNLGSERLFHSKGFIPTGEIDEDGEVVLRHQI